MYSILQKMLPDNVRKNAETFIAHLECENGLKVAFRPMVIGDLEAIFDIYEQSLYDTLLSDKVSEYAFMDLGAHIGIFTIKAAKRINQNRPVIAVEPDPSNYSLLLYNVSSNELPNVVTVNAAISDTCGVSNLYLFECSQSHSLLNRRRKLRSTVRVKTFTLDELIRRLEQTVIHERDGLVIKMNIEGAELNALRGGRRTIEKRKKIILMIQVHEEMATIEDVCSYLEECDIDHIGIIKGSSQRPYIIAWRSPPNNTTSETLSIRVGLES